MIIRTIVLPALLLGCVAAAYAQEPGSVHEKNIVFFNQSVAIHGSATEGIPDEMLQKAKSALNLSDVQVTAVKAPGYRR
jgi:hypothetical protein